jgi:hypothetical protein
MVSWCFTLKCLYTDFNIGLRASDGRRSRLLQVELYLETKVK